MINANLLIVDQDQKAADELGEKLQSIGYHIAGVASNREEVEKLISDKSIDLVMVNIGIQEKARFNEAGNAFGGSKTVPVIIHKGPDNVNPSNSTEPGTVDLVDYTGRVETLSQLIQLKLQTHNLELNLQDSEARYRDLYENPANLNLTIDTKGQILNCNNHTREVLSYTCEQDDIPSFYNICADSPDGRTKARDLISRLLAGKAVINERLQLIRGDGSSAWLSVAMTTSRRKDGDLDNILISGMDITSRVEAEEQIYLQAAALDTAANGIVITDRTSKIIWTNRAFTKLTGYEPDEVIGQNPNILKSGLHDAGFYNRLWNTIEAGKVWQGELTNRRKDGTLYVEEMTITPVKSSDGQITHFIAIKQDISERALAKQRLQYMATHDILTGLPNRALFYEKLKHALANAKRKKGRLGVMYLDMDGFKATNDAYGHQVGDKLLKAIAKRLNGSIRESDTICRMGGDEFTVCLENLANAADAEIVAQKLVTAMVEPFDIEGHEINLSTSIGISLYPDDGSEAEDLLGKADSALYNIKNRGKNGYFFYS